VNSEPLQAVDVPVLSKKTIYPAPFSAQVEGRIKHRLGEHFALTNFGINLTELEPGAVSALFHHHTKQDELIFVVCGNPTLVLGDREFVLKAGDCCGFKAGTGVGHQLINRSLGKVQYLEIGDRTPDESVEYPHDDLAFAQAPDGTMVLVHKDGTPY